ncbi:MAG: Ig-like domain-containing protein, partial [Myxococcales bacterium]|nr:Ig-like domain-containing protein [Myxococcales bacterium]
DAGEVLVGPLSAPVTSWAALPATADGGGFVASGVSATVATPTVYGAVPRAVAAGQTVYGPVTSFLVVPEPCALAPRCDDGNACTDDACTPYVGCTAPPAPDGTTCDDGDPATTVSTCEAGACQGYLPSQPVGSVDLGPSVGAGVIRRVVQVGGLVYVAVDAGGLRILDVSGGGDPVLVGAWSLAGADACTDLVVDGDYAILTCGGVLQVVNVSVVGAPVLVGSVPAAGATSVAFADGVLYVGVGAELWAYTLGAGGTLTYVGAWPSGGGTGGGYVFTRVFYWAGSLYGLLGDGTVVVWGFTTPTSPYVAWTWPPATAGVATDVVVVNGVLYVAYASYGVYAFDITNPAAPVQIWWSGAYPVTSLAVYGTVLVYGTADGAIVTTDVTDPAHPRVLSWSYAASGVTAAAVLVHQGVVNAFAAAGQTAVVLDVPPYVVAMSPHPGTLGLCAGGPVDLWFSSRLDPASVTADTVRVEAVESGVVTGQVAGALAVADARVTFTPDAGALPTGSYRVTVTDGVANTRGTPGPLTGFTADFSVIAACVRWTSAPSVILGGQTGAFTWDVDGGPAASGELLLATSPDPLALGAEPVVLPATAAGSGFTVTWTAPIVPQSLVYYALPRVDVGGDAVLGQVIPFIVSACPAGLGECDGNPANGCETNVLTSDDHCGACGNACGAAAQCEAGDCVDDPVCAAGTASCDGVNGNGCETVVGGNDVNNCGGCGIRCGGGVCSAGVCQATTLVAAGAAGSDLFGVDVDDDYLYWAARGSRQVLRATKDGQAVTVLASGYYAHDVAADATHVYFTTLTDGALYRVPREGGAVEPIAAGLATPFAIERWGDAVETTNYAYSGSGSIQRVSLLDGAVTTPVSGLSSLLGGLGRDRKFAYVSGWSAGAVYKVPVFGGTVETVASGLGNVEATALDAGYVYYAGGGLGRVHLATGDVEGFATTGTSYGVAVDDRYVYWTNNTYGTVNRLAKPVVGGDNLVCASLRGDCNADASDDCEVDLESDHANCGGCGVA